MSHFSLLVVDTENQKSVAEWMSPFYEGIEKDRLFSWSVQDVLNYFEKCGVNFHDGHVDESNLDEYLEVAKNLHIDVSEYDNEGNLYCLGNKDAKWDWYQIGGRWSNVLRKLDGTRCDTCEVKDLDLSLDTELYNEAKRFWEVVVDKQPLTDVERPNDFFAMFKPEYYIEMYGNKDNYAKDCASFSTFAMLLDGEWHEQGKMGWFAISDTTKESLEKFTDFMDKTLRDLKKIHPNAKVTLVDCHI